LEGLDQQLQVEAGEEGCEGEVSTEWKDERRPARLVSVERSTSAIRHVVAAVGVNWSRVRWCLERISRRRFTGVEYYLQY